MELMNRNVYIDLNEKLQHLEPSDTIGILCFY